MWTLLVLFLLRQVLSLYATLVRVTRAKEEQDSFRLPGSFESCSRENECNRFNANLTPTASRRDHCSCSCQKAATFSVKNGYWQCIDNREIRQKELSDCKRIRFNNETDTDLLRVFKVGESAAFNISLSTQGFVKTTRPKFSYQACDGGWILLNNTAFARGLQVTLKLLTHFTKNYLLKIDEPTLKPKDRLQGRVIKLVIPHGALQKKPFCLLFKVAGVMECPLNQILATGTPLTTAATTTTTTTKAVVHSPLSEAVIPTSHITATKIRKSQTIPTATEFPKTTLKVTHAWATDGGDQTLHKASAHFSVPLIAGTAGIAGIVLSVAFFVVLLRCRKGRKERHLSSTSFELKVTKLEDSADHCLVAEENAPYQFLSPSPDGVTERGVYVSRYNVPGALPAIKNCRAFTEGREPGSSVGMPTEKPASDEYDYAESSLVVRNNLLKIDVYPVTKEKASNTPKDNVPYYHVLEVGDEGLQSEEPSEGACRKPEEIAPCYQELEGPNPLDPQGCPLKRNQEGAHVSHHEETNLFHHILVESINDKQIWPSEKIGTCTCGEKGPDSSLNNEEYCDYKELKSDGRISKDYQALHKCAYVIIGDP